MDKVKQTITLKVATDLNTVIKCPKCKNILAGIEKNCPKCGEEFDWGRGTNLLWTATKTITLLRQEKEANGRESSSDEHTAEMV